MKKLLSASILILWLTLLLPKGYSQSRHNPARQDKQDFVYVLEDQGVRVYRVRRNGLLQPVPQTYLVIGQYPRSLAATPNGHTLYVSSDVQPNDYHSGSVFEFATHKNGSLSRLGKIGEIDAGSFPFPLAMGASGAFLYCPSEDEVRHRGLIYQYRVKADGSLVGLNPPFVSLGGISAHSLAVHPSGKYLYAATVGVPLCFRISPDGTLRRLPPAPVGTEVREMAVEPSGRFAYLLQRDAVCVARIDPRTGSLSGLRPVAHVTPDAYDLSINPRQRTLHVENIILNGKDAVGVLSEYRLVPDGTLNPSVPPIPSTFPPSLGIYRRLGVDARGGFVCVTRSR